jgi:rod shape-determining protein MreC
VSKVYAKNAEVILISDAAHASPVQSNRSGLRSIAVGTGDSALLSLPFVTVESDLKMGDLLISTGIGGVFPRGYPVAEVTRVERNPAATFAVVDARPTARLDRDREVLLVWFDTTPEVGPTDTAAPATGDTTPAAAVTPAGDASPRTDAASSAGSGRDPAPPPAPVAESAAGEN